MGVTRNDVVERLVDDVLDRRPRQQHEDLDDWKRRVAPASRLVLGSGRVVDLTHRPSVTHLGAATPLIEEELGRPWLRMIHEEQRPKSGLSRKRVPWGREALPLLEVVPPHWWQHTAAQVGEWAYVDLVAAYPSVYLALRLDCHFRPCADRPRLGLGRYEWLGKEQVREVKGAQRAVGGIIRATKMRVLDHGHLVTHNTIGWSPFLAPDLWGVVMFTMHAVAALAIREHGAVMWNTDGGVVPRDQAAGLVDKLASDWGLKATVRSEGPGTVWGLGSWQVGEKSTVVTGQVRKPLAGVMAVPQAVDKLLRKTRLLHIT